jgi:hypothetical protein
VTLSQLPVTSIIASAKDLGYQRALRILGAGNATLFKDIEHLIRLAAVIAIALMAFVILRAAVVPRSFGEYGHYRGAAVGEIASRPVAFAGHDTCEVCHTDIEVSSRVLDLDANGEVGNVGAVFGKQVAAIHHTLLRITAEVKFAGGDGSEAAGENAKFSAPSLSTPM